MSMHLRLLFVALALAPGLEAQLPAPPKVTAGGQKEYSDDPQGRSTPRGTVTRFVRTAEREDYDQAAVYLDTAQHGDQARELARELKTILDQGTSIDLDKLSTRPEGDPLDNQNPDRALVGVAKTSSGSMEIWLDRVRRGDNPPLWLFSRDTLQRVPEIYQDLNNTPGIERYLPGWVNTTLLSRPLWRWCIALLLIALSFVLSSFLVRLLKLLVTIAPDRILGTTEIVSVQGLVAPVRFILLGILFVGGGSYAYTLLRRHFWHDLGNVLIAFGVTWLSMRVVGIASDLTLARLKRTETLDKIALAGFLGQVFQITVFIIGAVVVLYLAGVNLTAALAGLGIGGLAVAFAAQKSLENLFGGIMIISDRPARIGDVCRIGDITGTVMSIGLRSTSIRTTDRTIVTIPNGQLAMMNLENYTSRDKFLFHHTISLRHQTTVDQMRSVLQKIRDLLDNHPNVESETARARFVGIRNASQDVEIFAYTFAGDYAKFLAVQEELLLRVLEIVESAGTALALPTQRTYTIRESNPSERRLREKTATTTDR